MRIRNRSGMLGDPNSQILSKLNDLERKSNEEEERRTDIHKSSAELFMERILFPIVMLVVIWYFLVETNLLLPTINPLGNIIYAAISYFETSGLVLWLIPYEQYASIVAGYTLLAIYGWVILLPVLWIFSSTHGRGEVIGNVLKWEFVILLFLVVPLAGTSLFSTTDAESGGVDGTESEAQSTWEKLTTQGALCYLTHTYSECESYRNNVEKEDTQREEYRIALVESKADIYPISYFDDKQYPVTYDILSLGEGIHIEKLECYQDRVSPKTLLGTTEIDEIVRHDKATKRSWFCDISNLTMEKVEEEITIRPVLYMTLDTKYTIRIPVVNIEEYQNLNNIEGDIYSLRSEIAEEYGTGTIISSTDALENEFFSIPTFPVVTGAESEEYEASFVIWAKDNSQFGKLINGELVEVDTTGLETLSVSSEFELPYNIGTGKEKSILRFTMTPQGSSEEVLEEDILTLLVKTKTQKESSVKVTITDDKFAQRQLSELATKLSELESTLSKLDAYTDSSVDDLKIRGENLRSTGNSLIEQLAPEKTVPVSKLEEIKKSSEKFIEDVEEIKEEIDALPPPSVTPSANQTTGGNQTAGNETGEPVEEEEPDPNTLFA